MPSVAENQIFEDNLKVLQNRLPAVFKALAADDRSPLFKAVPYVNDNGEINLTCFLPDGSQVAMYDDAEIAKGAASLMANWKIESCDSLVFHGFGLGYGALAALNTIGQKPHIIIVDNQPGFFKMALGLVDLRQLLDYERLHLFIGSGLDADDIIAECKEIISFGTTRLVNNPAYARILGQPYQDFNRKLQSTIGAMRDVWYTAKKFGRQMISNTMDNLPSIAGSTPLASLKGRFKGIPAFYVAAGPSLDESLDELRKIGHRALIVSSDSAAAALIRNNIMPHVVVTVDRHKINFEKIRPVLDHLREPVLVFGVESNPDNVRACLSRRRIAVTADSRIINSWIGPRWNLDSQLPPLNSVSLAAIHTAHFLGCEPIVLAGMDLGFVETRSHSKAAANHYTPDKNKRILLDGVNGSPVYSLPQLAADKALLERAVAAGNLRVINTSLRGASIVGTQIKTLAAVIEQELKSDVDLNKIFSSIDWISAIPLTEIAEELQSMLGRLANFKKSCQSGIKISEHALGRLKAGHKVSGNDLIELNDYLQHFQEENQMLITLLEGARLDSVQDLFRKREQIEFRRNTMDGRQIVVAELEIIAAFFRSQYETALFFEAQIRGKSTYFGKIVKLMGGPVESAAKYLDLARHHAAANELWQAEEAYRTCLMLDGTDETVRQEIIELYTAFEMWPQAKTQLEAAAQCVPRASCSNTDKKKINFENSSQMMQENKQMVCKPEGARHEIP